MTISASTCHKNMKMSWRRAKSPGWAAFDVSQQRKQDLELEADNEPYPPISSTVVLLHPCQNLVKNNALSERSFSSVLLPSANFTALMANRDIEKPLHVGNINANQNNNLTAENKENDVLQAYGKLKELHCWADKSLIEDIMAAANNDIDKASTLLKVMASSDSFEENNETNIAGLEDNFEDFLLDNNTLPVSIGVSLTETTDLAELRCVNEDDLNYKNKEQIDVHASHGKMIPDDGISMQLILDNLRFPPIEPEWEEDDIYLIHRKDAMRMTRSASQHSKATNDAYQRGDHSSAQKLSLKAREEWRVAERLNAKAANEIQSIKNFKNDMWKLDLHGLHSAEAVEALQGRLWKIECQVQWACSAPLNRVNTEAGIVCSSSLESLSHTDMDKFDKQQISSRQRSTPLQVITGRGNHSRGQAALPTAIRSFLDEKGYHYDEAKPGVIIVRPKFRRQ